MSTVIQVEGLTFAYEAEEGTEPVPVLKGVDLTIEKGTFVAVIGHNGSGKSTLAKQFNGILLPTGGAGYEASMEVTSLSLSAANVLVLSPDSVISFQAMIYSSSVYMK